MELPLRQRSGRDQTKTRQRQAKSRQRKRFDLVPGALTELKTMALIVFKLPMFW